MGRARDPGWGKRSTGAVGRHGYGVKKNQKPVKQAWMLGEQAKQALRAAPRRAPARAANEQAAERAQPSPEAPPLPASSRKPATAKSMDASKVAGRKRKRQWRDETGGIAKAPRGDKNAKARKERAATVAAIPKDIGASAATRHAAFARVGRSADAARQSAEYHERMASKHLKKLARKDPVKAAATLGAVNRDPELRPLRSW